MDIRLCRSVARPERCRSALVKQRRKAKEHGYFRCLSRVVDRRFILDEVEKEHFVSLLREYEAFCVVKVLTY